LTRREATVRLVDNVPDNVVNGVAMARPNIKDVAERGGVSYKTVSRVVNRHPDVNPATRLRVEMAVAELGYQPDPAARSLRRGRVQALRLLLVRRYERFLTEPFLDEVVSGIVDQSTRAGYALMLEVVGPRDTDSPGLHSAERRVDATLLIDGRRLSPLLPPPDRVAAPWVVLPTRPARDDVGWVYADFRGGAVQVVNHLLGLGHRRIAHLTGRLTLPERDRLTGYRLALEAAGIRIDPQLVVAAGHLRHHGYAAMEKLLARTADFTAVFAVNDLTALGAMECLQRRGIRVPEDVSIAGFDDIYLARYAAPPLTTLRLPAYEIGVAATEMAIAAVEGSSLFPDGREFPVALCPRASTGAPPTIDRRGR
jgi:DNA-binding LacI/PurR family transcriptional regulator